MSELAFRLLGGLVKLGVAKVQLLFADRVYVLIACLGCTKNMVSADCAKLTSANSDEL